MWFPDCWIIARLAWLLAPLIEARPQSPRERAKTIFVWRPSKTVKNISSPVKAASAFPLARVNTGFCLIFSHPVAEILCLCALSQKTVITPQCEKIAFVAGWTLLFQTCDECFVSFCDLACLKISFKTLQRWSPRSSDLFSRSWFA